MLLTGITFAMATITFTISALMAVSLTRIRYKWELPTLYFLLSVYIFGYGMELVSETIEFKMAFNHFQYFGIPFISSGWAFLAHRYRNPDLKLKKGIVFLLLLIPLTVFVSVQLFYYTDCTLYYTEAFIDGSYRLFGNEFPVLILGKGPLYYLGTSYNMVMILYATYVYYKTFTKTTGAQKHQTFLLTICSLLSMIIPMLSFISNQTMGIDLAVYIITILGYVILYSLLKYEFLYLTPSAHQQAFETASEKMYLFDDKLELISWNKAVKEDNIYKEIVQYRMKGEDFFQNEEIIDSIKEGVPYSLNVNDKHYVIETIPVVSKKGKKDGYIVKFNDMTSYIERIEKLDYQASHDELTDIYNRRAFLEIGAEFINKAGAERIDFSVMMIDLDDFKNINDTYGHPFGDEVLKGVVKAIRESLEPNDILCRYGGEEFIAIAKNISHEQAAVVAEKIRSRIEKKVFKINDEVVSTKVSIGACLSYHDNPLTIEEYIKNADDALYVSKRKGKNKVTIV